MKKKLILGVAALGLAGITSILSPVVSNASDNAAVLVNTEVEKQTPTKTSEYNGKYYYTDRFFSYDEGFELNEVSIYDFYRFNDDQEVMSIYSCLRYISNSVLVTKGLIIGFDYNLDGQGVDEILEETPGIIRLNITDNVDDDDLFQFQSPDLLKSNIVSNGLTYYGFASKEILLNFLNNDYDQNTAKEVYGYIICGKLAEADLQAPNVEYPSNYVINVDNMQSVDEILSHITVTDDTDEDPQIVIKSNAYNPAVKKTGTYPMVIYAQDSSGNKTSEYTINVIVSDVTAPVITKPSNAITVGNSKTLSDSQILAYFSATDNYSSNEKITLTLTRNDYKGKENKVGTYSIIVKATDEAGNYSSVETSIKVVDDTKPTLTASNKTQPNNVKLSQSDLLALFTAADDTSSNITKKITADNYTANYNKKGNYTVTCRATDEAGNYVDKTITISVVDKVNPTINNVTKTTEYSNKITDFKSLFTYSDDTSAKDNITFEIISDGYTATYNKKGEYIVKAKVTDEAGNSATGTLTITVKDTTAPIITAPANVEIGNSVLFTIDNLKEKIVVNDGYDGKLTNYELTDVNNYAANYKTVGNYKFTIKATDSSGNTVTGTITLVVSDTTAPEIFYDSYFILVREGEELTNEMIISYATQVLGLDDGASIVSLTGEYDTAKAGVYTVALTLDNGDIETFNINVSEEPKEEPKWSAKSFFSTNMDNWTDFTQWKAWSILAWLSWCGIGLGVLFVLKTVLSILRKKIR